MSETPPLTGAELDREVEYAISHYPVAGNCTTRVEYSMALEIRRLLDAQHDVYEMGHRDASE